MFRCTCFTAVSLLLVVASANAAPSGEEKKPVYKACPKDKVWSESQNGCVCAPGFNWNDATRSCISASAPPPPPPKAAPAPPPPPPTETKCPANKQWSEAHNGCIVTCLQGKVANAKGDACVATAAAPTTTASAAPPKPACPSGKQWHEGKRVCAPICGVGTTLDEKNMTCVAVNATTKACPEGKEWKDAFGGCVPICADSQVLDFTGTACHPIRIVRRPR